MDLAAAAEFAAGADLAVRADLVDGPDFKVGADLADETDLVDVEEVDLRAGSFLDAGVDLAPFDVDGPDPENEDEDFTDLAEEDNLAKGADLAEDDNLPNFTGFVDTNLNLAEGRDAGNNFFFFNAVLDDLMDNELVALVVQVLLEVNMLPRNYSKFKKRN